MIITDEIVKKENYHFLRDILSESEVPLIMTDKDGVIKYISDYILKTITESKQWKDGRLLCDFLEDVYKYKNIEPLREAIQKGELWQADLVYNVDSDQCFYHKITVKPIKENNEIISFSAIINDETVKKALEVAREEAKNAKDGFLSNMSHEIKTPMNAIVGMTNLLVKTELNSKQRDYAHKISSSSKKLTRIINDIIDYSNIEKGKIKFENYSFSLDETLDSIADVMGHEAFEKGIEFIISKNPYLPPYILGDPLRLDQILINLIGNAIKFTKQGEVTLKVDEVSRTDDTIVMSFEIKDTGKGMSEEEKELMFSVFSKGDTSITRKHEGIGLGLTIVKGLLDKLDTELKVESELGKGSIFSFQVPFKISTEQESVKEEIPESLMDLKVAVVDDNAVAREVIVNYLNKFNNKPRAYSNGYNLISDMDRGEEYDLIILDYKMPEIDGIEIVKEIEKLHVFPEPKFIMVTAYPNEDLYDKAEKYGVERVLMKPASQTQLYNNINQLFNTESKAAQGVYFDDAKVLLVEDNLINQQVATELLEQRGFIVDIANNGVEAVDLVEQHGLDYSMVLMDLQMPEMDGYTAAEIIRKTYGFDELPIIAVSANLKDEVLSRVIELDMQDYVSKPIDPKVLFDAIERWINPMYIVIREEITAEKKETSDWDMLQSMMPSFEIDVARNRISNNYELYKKLLTKFVSSNKDTADELEGYLIANDRTNAEMVAHTIKGVAGNIGATELFEKSKELEFKSKDMSVNLYQVANSYAFESFRSELVRVIFEIENSNITDSKTQAGNTSNISKDDLIDKLDKLVELLDDFDTDSEDLFEEIKGSIEALGYKEQCNNIQGYISDYEFDDARDEAQAILDDIKK